MSVQDEVVVAEFKKNQRDIVRAVLKTWNGRRLLDLRVYYKQGEVWLPSPKGLCLQTATIPDLKAAVAALDQALAGEENAHAD